MGLEQGLEGVRKKQEGTESPCCELEGSGLPWGERLKCSLGENSQPVGKPCTAGMLVCRRGQPRACPWGGEDCLQTLVQC